MRGGREQQLAGNATSVGRRRRLSQIGSASRWGAIRGPGDFLRRRELQGGAGRAEKEIAFFGFPEASA